MARKKSFEEKEVVNKAIELFIQKGYHGTSMDDLVKNLRINRASMYNTFGSKKELYCVALQKYGEARAKQIADFLYYQINVRQGMYKLFEALLLECLKPKKKNGCLLVNSITEMAGEDAEIKNLTIQQEEILTTAIYNYLKYGVENGQISHYKNIKQIASYFFVLYTGVMVNSINKENNDDLLLLINSSISMLD